MSAVVVRAGVAARALSSSARGWFAASWTALSLWALSLSGGCGGSGLREEDIAALEADVAERVAAFDTDGFVRISATAFPTAHAVSPDAHTWVSTDGAEAFRAIDPADDDQTVEPFPEGFIAIKEQTEGEVPVGKLLVGAKFPAGYAPEGGDWWWAIFDDKDTLTNIRGTPSRCTDCHAGYARTDYLGGVDVVNRE